MSSCSSYRAGDREVPIPAFLGVEELRRAHRDRSRFGLPEGVLVIASGGHEWLGLDYRDGPFPRVVFQEHEGAPLEDVAASFEDLLEGLREDE